MSMIPLKPDIDLNRRTFIKTSLVLAGAFLLGKVSGLLPPPTPSSAPRTPPIGTKEYTNTDYGFSFLLPRDLTVSTFDEGGGAATITFQNSEKAEGFQLFITPYGESQVSEKRFTLDVPSGIRESVTPVVIDGATGAAFYSSNSALGATREVWVVHGGFLYEATAPKPLDAWLDTIIQTWRFI